MKHACVDCSSKEKVLWMGWAGWQCHKCSGAQTIQARAFQVLDRFQGDPVLSLPEKIEHRTLCFCNECLPKGRYER